MNQDRVPLDILKSLLDYNPEKGELYFKVKRPGKRIGQRVGSIDKKGYRRTKLCGRFYQEHILIWFYETGEWPSKQIDHIDRNKSNNRFSNLRLATNREQQGNIGESKANTSGYRGVTKSKTKGKWIAQIMNLGKVHYLGTFATKEEAREAYKEAALRFFGEFFSDNIS